MIHQSNRYSFRYGLSRQYFLVIYRKILIFRKSRGTPDGRTTNVFSCHRTSRQTGRWRTKPIGTQKAQPIPKRRRPKKKVVCDCLWISLVTVLEKIQTWLVCISRSYPRGWWNALVRKVREFWRRGIAQLVQGTTNASGHFLHEKQTNKTKKQNKKTTTKTSVCNAEESSKREQNNTDKKYPFNKERQ